jgi:hypothetical protein
MGNIVLGGLLVGVGLVITVGTYAAAANGGTYVVAFGPIIFGGIRLLKGLGEMMGGE